MAKARRFLVDALRDLRAEDHEWVASQVLSELATNAVLHARTPFSVRVSVLKECLRLEVKDGTPHHPVRRRYDVDTTTGRGLALVDRLGSRWGVVDEPDGGKVVWCEIDLAQTQPGGYFDVGQGSGAAARGRPSRTKLRDGRSRSGNRASRAADAVREFHGALSGGTPGRLSVRAWTSLTRASLPPVPLSRILSLSRVPSLAPGAA